MILFLYLTVFEACSSSSLGNRNNAEGNNLAAYQLSSLDQLHTLSANQLLENISFCFQN